MIFWQYAYLFHFGQLTMLILIYALFFQTNCWKQVSPAVGLPYYNAHCYYVNPLADTMFLKMNTFTAGHVNNVLLCTIWDSHIKGNVSFSALSADTDDALISSWVPNYYVFLFLLNQSEENAVANVEYFLGYHSLRRWEMYPLCFWDAEALANISHWKESSSQENISCYFEGGVSRG